MARPRVLTAVDVGSAKITALMVEVGQDGRLHHIGSGAAAARGIIRGSVADIGIATASIGKALEQLAAAAGAKPSNVILGSSMPTLSHNSRGTFVASRSGGPISRDDVRKAVAAAATVEEVTQAVVHAIPRRFIVDRDTDIRDPIGLTGKRIDADVHLVTLPASSLNTLVSCVEGCGVAVSQVVSQPIAAAQAVLTAEERELGVAVADVGFAGTQIAVFIDGCPWHTATIPIGGKHVTQDLAILLRLGNESADSLKLSTGCSQESADAAEEMLDVFLAEEDTTARVSSNTVREIIEARVVELIGLIDEEIRRSGYAGLLPSGLVITGGTSCMSGIARVMSQHLQMRVRIGQPEALSNTEIAGPAYASTIGLVGWHLATAVQNWWNYPASVGLSTVANCAIRPAAPWWRSLWSVARDGTRNARADRVSTDW